MSYPNPASALSRLVARMFPPVPAGLQAHDRGVFTNGLFGPPCPGGRRANKKPRTLNASAVSFRSDARLISARQACRLYSSVFFSSSIFRK